MQEVSENLLKIYTELQHRYEQPTQLINRLIEEGKNTSEIEEALLLMNKIEGVCDSVKTALRILEG